MAVPAAIATQANIIIFFSALASLASFSIFSINTLSPFSNSSRLTSYNSLIRIILITSGSDFPFSQLEMVCLETRSFSAACSCVYSFLMRALLILSAIFICPSFAYKITKLPYLFPSNVFYKRRNSCKKAFTCPNNLPVHSFILFHFHLTSTAFPVMASNNSPAFFAIPYAKNGVIFDKSQELSPSILTKRKQYKSDLFF